MNEILRLEIYFLDIAYNQSKLTKVYAMSIYILALFSPFKRLKNAEVITAMFTEKLTSFAFVLN